VDAEGRAAFLEHACAGDDELRREVDSLISSNEQAAEDFMSAPALAVAAEMLSESEAEALTGQTIAHYRVLSLIGAGGMGGSIGPGHWPRPPRRLEAPCRNTSRMTRIRCSASIRRRGPPRPSTTRTSSPFTRSGRPTPHTSSPPSSSTARHSESTCRVRG